MTDSKIPFHIQKALSGGSPEEELTNYKYTEPEITITSGVNSSYRTPVGRATGNDYFRRYADGSLDIEHAKNEVLTLVHAAKDGQPLTDLQQCVLTCCFPGAFDYMDPVVANNLREINLRVTPDEVFMIALRVSACLAEEMNYNAGLGGGSVPGRNVTRA